MVKVIVIMIMMVMFDMVSKWTSSQPFFISCSFNEFDQLFLTWQCCSSAMTASWWVTILMSVVFTARTRSPIRSLPGEDSHHWHGRDNDGGEDDGGGEDDEVEAYLLQQLRLPG